jgi:hypothetical protein
MSSRVLLDLLCGLEKYVLFCFVFVLFYFVAPGHKACDTQKPELKKLEASAASAKTELVRNVVECICRV